MENKQKVEVKAGWTKNELEKALVESFEKKGLRVINHDRMDADLKLNDNTINVIFLKHPPIKRDSGSGAITTYTEKRESARLCLNSAFSIWHTLTEYGFSLGLYHLFTLIRLNFWRN